MNRPNDASARFQLTLRAEAATLCLFPGWGFDARVFDRVAWPASTIAIDGWQTGRSEDELRAFLEAHALDRVWLFGWSLGGLRALAWARRFPDRVAGLLLAGIRPEFTPEELDQQRRALDADPPGALRHFYRRVFFGDFAGRKAEARPLARTLESSLVVSLDLPSLQAGLDELRHVCLQPKDLSFGTPARWPALVHGQRDIIAPVEQVQELVRDAPELLGRLTVLADAGHAVFLSDDFPAWLTQQLTK